jgi:hypothetical protein
VELSSWWVVAARRKLQVGDRVLARATLFAVPLALWLAEISAIYTAGFLSGQPWG